MKILFEKNLHPEVDAFEKDNKYFCGNCAKEVEKGTETCPRCNSELIYDSWGASSKVLYNTRITISENEDKLFINVFQGKTSLVNGKFYFQKYICPFVFNFKTGQSYKLPILNGETKRALRIKGNGIQNISYRPAEIPSLNPIRKEVEQIFKNKASQHTHYADEIDRLENSKGDDVAKLMLSITKFKYCNQETEAVIASLYAERSLKPARKYWLKPKARENIQKCLGAHYSLNMWKWFKNDFERFSHAYKIGYLKPDNQKKIIQAIRSIQGPMEGSLKNSWGISVNYINLFVDMIRLSDNENEMAKKISRMILANPRVSEWIIYDAVDMLKQILDAGMSVKHILKMRSFDEIHDAAEDAYYQMKQGNKAIKISPKEEALNSTEDAYKFTVCTETDQLTAIGNTMHICVGSYGDRAVNKECLIVKGEINNKLFACIEIRGKRLAQAKGYCNKLLEGEEREAVIKWAEEKGLSYKSCFDLKERSIWPEDEEHIPIIDWTFEDEEPAREPIAGSDVTEDEESFGDIWLPF